ncbi:MAG: hypothetical protein AAF572_15865 [Cyanobacteria bacterium P01_B01_bin.77]
MNILFVDGIEYQAAGLLHQLTKYGRENACVVDFPTQDSLINGLGFIFKEPDSIANLSVIVHRCHNDFCNTEGYFYNDVKYYADVEQYVDLHSDHICPLGTKVFDAQRSLLERKDCLEQMLISEGAIDRFTSFTAPDEFWQELKARRGADYWGNR